MVNGIMVEISSNVGHKEYIGVCVPRPCVCCMCVLALANFVVIILGYTANAGARRVPSVPSVCHCIDDELARKGKGQGVEEREAWLQAFFFGSHCMVLDLVFIQTE